jgi:acyl dehydratase
VLQAPPSAPSVSRGWIRDITPDAIRHFAWGIGDANPLWLDHDHGRRSPWRATLAPPCILYAVEPGAACARAQWEWFDVIREGQTIFAETDADEVSYRDGDGAVLAVARFGMPALPAPDDATPHRYEADELAAIEADVLAEPRRGERPRHWEDVEVGEPIPPVVKGPLSMIDVVAWYAGAHGGELRASPELEGLGRQALPQQRVAWAQHMLSNWLGDGGFPRSCEVTLEAPVVLGDTTWWRGAVSAKSRAGALAEVRFSIESVNQRGETTATGTAAALLPSRGTGPVRLPLNRKGSE